MSMEESQHMDDHRHSRLSRLSTVHSNVRAFLRNPIPSSEYSRSQHSTVANTPRVSRLLSPIAPSRPYFGLFGQSRPSGDEEQAILQPAQPIHAQSPQFYYPTANPSPTTPNTFPPYNGVDASLVDAEEAGLEDEGETQEIRVRDRRRPDLSVDPHIEELAAAARVMRRRKRKHKHRRGAWIRRKDQGSLWRGSTRPKCFQCLLSGILLLVLLAVYLTLALALSLNKVAHIIFILVILGIALFFSYSLITLLLMAFKPVARRHRNHRRRELHREHKHNGQEDYHPPTPIRVHVVADEEVDRGHIDGDEQVSTADGEKIKKPPPAYGLWRSSVRLNPTLLHWQRVPVPVTSPTGSTAHLLSPDSASPSPISSHGAPLTPLSPEMVQTGSLSAGAGHGEGTGAGMRPPSYVSDDGVEYAVAAQPRSTTCVPVIRPPSQLHPALRRVG